MTIKELRQSLNLSQPKFAKALGIGVSSVGGYEVGRIKPSDKVVAKIKDVFGVDLAAELEKVEKAVEEVVAQATTPAPAATPIEEKPVATPAVEEKPAPKKKAAAKKAKAAPAPAVEAVATPAEEKPAPKKKAAAKKAPKKEKAAPAVEAVAEEKAVAAPAVEEKPALKKTKAPAKKPAAKKAPAKKQAKIIIQAVMGGEITVEEILAKVGDVDAVYVKPEENAIYWTKGDQSGAVNIW